MSFANQYLAVRYLLENKGRLDRRVYNPPRELDEMVARLKLDTMGVRIDELTPEQAEYLKSWSYGT